MSAATVIREAEQDGLRFTLTPSRTIKLTGRKEVAEKWAPRLREHKAEIVESLAALGSNAVDAEPIDGYTYDPAEAACFWHRFTERIDECDRLIHELCDLRGDTDAHRADLLAVRKRMAPDRIDSDIRYLLEEIERVTPTPSPEPKRDCRDCEHHRGRNNNAARYCVSHVGAAQRDDVLASPIVDCSIASRCQAFKKITPTTQKPRRYRKPLDRVIAHRNPIHFFERYP